MLCKKTLLLMANAAAPTAGRLYHPSFVTRSLFGVEDMTARVVSEIDYPGDQVHETLSQLTPEHLMVLGRCFYRYRDNNLGGRFVVDSSIRTPSFLSSATGEMRHSLDQARITIHPSILKAHLQRLAYEYDVLMGTCVHVDLPSPKPSSDFPIYFMKGSHV